MACSATKGRVAAPAMDLYQGVMYSTFRANAPATRPPVVILSAKHGFIEADRVINPYDQRMTEARADEMVAALPAFDAIEWPCGVSSILMAGGKAYQRVMRAAIERRIELGLLDADISIENTHGGIGYQRAQLGAHLRALANETTGVPPELVDYIIKRGQEERKLYNTRINNDVMQAAMKENALKKEAPWRDNALKGAVPATEQIHIRVIPARKNRYVRQAQAEGMKLSDWIQKHMDSVCDAASQPDTTLNKDNGDNHGQE